MKPIETHYSGCKFRSRTEARWAVFFDALEWRWAFEEEGYELPSGWYLPDFKIWPHGKKPVWFEVKPFKDDCPDDPRWTDLAMQSRMTLITAYGMHRTGDRCERSHMMRLTSPLGGSFPRQYLWMDFTHAWDAASSSRFEFGQSGPQ